MQTQNADAYHGVKLLSGVFADVVLQCCVQLRVLATRREADPV